MVVLGACRSAQPIRTGPAEVPRGIREVRDRRRQEIGAATSGTIPAAAGAVVEDSGHEGDPGARAELLRGFSGAVAWPGCWTAAAQCHDAGRDSGTVEDLRDEEVIFYCRSGNRSGIAAMVMDHAGFTNTKNLTGGMLAWQEKFQ